MEKISIVIPVYKVELYLRKCLDSVVGQTYKNLEIILVDDGSPDNCGTICDEYAERDARIRVLHKKNGGLASARNAGLTAATGEWIGWVDSDDWVEPDMYEYLLENAVRTNADVAVCGTIVFSKKKDHVHHDAEQLLDTEAAIAELAAGKIQDSVWDKLWRSELFDGLSFPEGRNFEDTAVIHRLIERATRVICLPECKYYYCLRPGSITYDHSLQNQMEYFLVNRQRYTELSERWPRLRPQLGIQCVVGAALLWMYYYDNPPTIRQEYLPQLRKTAAFCREHYKDALRCKTVGPSARAVSPLTAHASWWAFGLAWLAGRLRRLKHGA